MMEKEKEEKEEEANRLFLYQSDFQTVSRS